MPPKRTTSGGDFVKMKDYASALAVAFEPTQIERDVPNTKNPKWGPRDILHVDLTIFDKAALDGGKPDTKKGAKVTERAFTTTYGREIGEQVIGRIILKPGVDGGNDFYVPVDVDDAVYDKVCAYLEQRDAKVEALKASSGPSWDSED